MIATSGFLTALKCTKFVFGRGYAPDPTGEPDPVARLRDPTSKGKGRWGRGERGGEGGQEGKNRPPFRKFLDPSL